MQSAQVLDAAFHSRQGLRCNEETAGLAIVAGTRRFLTWLSQLPPGAPKMHVANICTLSAALLMATPAAIATQPCTQFSPSPIPIQQLPAFFPPQHHLTVTTLLETEAIRQTLSLYPYIVDGRTFSSLSSVFTLDATANYSVPLGVLNGPSLIASTLESALAPFPETQHLLGSRSVRICENERAISVAYYRATHFLPQNRTVGPGAIVGFDGVLYAYGQYQDTWEKRDGLWKIVYRNLVYMVSD